ncbi:hypothetical protein [Neokomagataea tanensis]|uniref:hypothetical protein n=1 Tax=Neokomagataea TaxID=1223423 RepID=UPI0014771E02|nr:MULTISPECIES: hypothetical protein [Neokomagataea]
MSVFIPTTLPLADQNVTPYHRAKYGVPHIAQRNLSAAKALDGLFLTFRFLHASSARLG